MHVAKTTLTSLLALLLVGCPDDGEEMDTGSETEGVDTESGGETEGDCTPGDGMVAPLDTSACAPNADDYQPRTNASADDMWPECMNDDGTFHPEDTPSAAGRTEAHDMIRTIFAGGTSTADFIAAREQYTLAEGLESRVIRREDVHYPNIPEDTQDPTVDFDKQCTIAANVAAYPDRCAGPAKIAPTIDDAFEAGINGTGDPAVAAAKIDAALVWFGYISIMKEATFSCPPADLSGDCDSAWGYYNGGTQRSGGLGFAEDVTAASAEANDRVFDGLSAMRCWRYEYAPEEDADVNDPLYIAGAAQLDQANNHAAAVVLRARLVEQLACGADAAANWAWIQVFGQAIIKPAQDANAGMASTWTALIANPAPTPEEIEAGIAALDAMFPCP
jgi:hypothetical protein